MKVAWSIFVVCTLFISVNSQSFNPKSWPIVSAENFGELLYNGLFNSSNLANYVNETFNGPHICLNAYAFNVENNIHNGTVKIRECEKLKEHEIQVFFANTNQGKFHYKFVKDIRRCSKHHDEKKQIYCEADVILDFFKKIHYENYWMLRMHKNKQCTRYNLEKIHENLKIVHDLREACFQKTEPWESQPPWYNNSTNSNSSQPWDPQYPWYNNSTNSNSSQPWYNNSTNSNSSQPWEPQPPWYNNSTNFNSSQPWQPLPLGNYNSTNSNSWDPWGALSPWFNNSTNLNSSQTLGLAPLATTTTTVSPTTTSRPSGSWFHHIANWFH